MMKENMGKQWNTIFRGKGKVFKKPQEDIPKVLKLLRKKGVERVLDLGYWSGKTFGLFGKTRLQCLWN